MKMLIAEDEPMFRRLLEVALCGLTSEVITAEDGTRAWELLGSRSEIQIAILDWVMPGLSGLEICRNLRQRTGPYVYVILLTAKDRKEDVVLGLEAGADDYITKPFDVEELRSRVRAGERIVRLESRLGDKVRELEDALSRVRQLEGLIPICMHCKKIRDDQDVWHRLEAYIQERSQAVFTHSLCSDCLAKHYPDLAETAARQD